METKTSSFTLSDDAQKSIAGFFIALFVGALAPRAIMYFVRRVMVRSVREVLVVVAAGWLSERLVRLLSERTKPEAPHS